jgi:hypothetical protein
VRALLYVGVVVAFVMFLANQWLGIVAFLALLSMAERRERRS